MEVNSPGGILGSTLGEKIEFVEVIFHLHNSFINRYPFSLKLIDLYLLNHALQNRLNLLINSLSRIFNQVSTAHDY